MEYIYSIEPTKQETLRKILSDLIFALKGLSKDEIVFILKYSLSISFKNTINSKKRILKKSLKFLKKTYHRYQENGFIYSINQDYLKTKAFVSTIPTKTKAAYNYFINLSEEEQIKLIVGTFWYLSVFSLTSGGLDFDGGVPDLDLAIGGIGLHRSILTHSILPGFGLELATRFIVHVLITIKDRMPNNYHPIWDKIFEEVDRYKDLTISAMWLGIGTHLLVDTGIIGDGFTPYKDLPFSTSESIHKTIFSLNGFFGSLFSINDNT